MKRAKSSLPVSGFALEQDRGLGGRHVQGDFEHSFHVGVFGYYGTVSEFRRLGRVDRLRRAIAAQRPGNGFLDQFQ